MQEVLGIVIGAVAIVTNICWLIVVIKQTKELRECAKLLASRTFSEYSIGEARLAETRHEQKPAEGYESVWERGNE